MRTDIIQNILVGSYKMIASTQVILAMGEGLSWEVHDSTTDSLLVRFSIGKDEKNPEAFTKIEPEGTNITNVTAFNIPEPGKLYVSKLQIGTIDSDNKKLFMSYYMDGGGSLQSYLVTINLYIEKDDGQVK